MVQNEKQRNFNLSLIVNLIDDALEYLTMVEDPKESPEASKLVQELSLTQIVFLSKLYFMERRLSRAGNDLTVMNQFVEDNPFIL